MYSEKIMNTFLNPSNVGIIQGADGVGQFVDNTTADTFKLYIKVEDGKITNASFKAYTGVVGIAIMSTLTTMLKDVQVEDATKIDINAIKLQVGEVDKEHSYLLGDAIETLKATYTDYQKKLAKEQERLKKEQNK